MTNREEFCALLYGTFYESISDSAIIRQQHEKIRTWVQNNIPSRLYRYRAVNEHTFDALRKDEIWGSSIFSFNDPFECMPHYDPERAKELLKREMDIGRIAEKYRAYKNGGSVPALQSIFSEEQLQWLFSVLPEDIQPEALEKPFSLFRENALRLLECCQDEFEKVFYRTLIDEQKRRSIACFTESNDNSAMWGHYADSHRGFCIEYDFQKILTACSEKCADVQHCTSLMMSPAIAPMIYTDVRYDASQIILPLLLSRMADLAHTAIKPFYEDLLVIVKSLLTKSSVWSYENEWRMISMLPDNTLFCRIYSLKPTAVYIGVRTDEEAANTLYQICCEKDIPCKGNQQTKAAYEMMENCHDFNFVGNIEAKHLFSGEVADVVVCDGFVGNTIIKQVEGVYSMALHDGLKNSYFNKLNYETVGGTPVLGINAPVLIGHGCSSAEAIKNMVLQTEKTIKAQLDSKLRERFS